MSQLKNLQYDAENQRVFIITGAGQLFIYTLTEKPPKLVKDSETGSKGVLRDLCIDYVRSYIFICKSLKKFRCNGWDDISIGDRQTREG
jgi:hypothetical protein